MMKKDLRGFCVVYLNKQINVFGVYRWQCAIRGCDWTGSWDHTRRGGGECAYLFVQPEQHHYQMVRMLSIQMTSDWDLNRSLPAAVLVCAEA